MQTGSVRECFARIESESNGLALIPMMQFRGDHAKIIN